MFTVNRSEGNKVADFKASEILFSAQNPVDQPILISFLLQFKPVLQHPYSEASLSAKTNYL